jgi:hypothetical protein
MRKALKFAHTLAACGFVGSLLAYAVVLAYGRQATPALYADMRATIDLICTYVLLPSLGVVLVSGLLAMAAHKPFLKLRWVWVKALLGISTFEGTLIVIQGRARKAAEAADEIVRGAGDPAVLAKLISSEWAALFVILAIALANIVLGVWRPVLAGRSKAVPVPVDAKVDG